MKRTIAILLVLINLFAFGQEIKFTNFKPSECDKSKKPISGTSKIVKQKYNGDTLVIEVSITATCCVDFEPSISFDQDTLNLAFMETGDPCECICCYQFTYHILGLKGIDFKTKIYKKYTHNTDEVLVNPVKYYINNGDTTGYKDKYGNKQGVIYIKTENGNYIETFYKNNVPEMYILKNRDGVIIKKSPDWFEILTAI